jgi:predicted ribosome quality control (RQC) complex YloA/Tae2 family protein
MSRFRQILPGNQYKFPPAQEKLQPIDLNLEEFNHKISILDDNTRISKFISNTIDGISIFASREICYNSGLDESTGILDLDDKLKSNLYKSLSDFCSNIIHNNFVPCLYNANGVAFDFYCFKLNYLNHLETDIKNSIFDTIESFYFRKDNLDRIKQKSSDILKVVNNNLDKSLRKLSIQNDKLLECIEKDKWKLNGDLIMSNLYAIKKGDAKAAVINYFDEKQSDIEIPLDLLSSPVENAQRYYKNYNKEKRAESHAEEQKKEILQEIEYLETQLVNIDNCTEDNEIDEIRSELISLGYIRKGRKTASRKLKQSKPNHYISTDGFEIFVGKNNIQNDFLTTKFAEPMDIWMHTKNIPGSHVIIKVNSKPVTETVLNEAANLAAYYSKARNSSSVPVDYTERKNVKKPSGAKPGMVIYYTNRTVYITPDEEKIYQLKTT